MVEGEGDEGVTREVVGVEGEEAEEASREGPPPQVGPGPQGHQGRRQGVHAEGEGPGGVSEQEEEAQGREGRPGGEEDVGFSLIYARVVCA